MGRELGVDVELQHVLLKYPGLVPWEIWLSEAQERMVIAVPPDALERLSELARLWEVELSVLGRFTGDGRLCVRYANRVVADLPMSFLHDGLPQRRLRAEYVDPAPSSTATPHLRDAAALLLRMLAHPTSPAKRSPSFAAMTTKCAAARSAPSSAPNVTAPTTPLCLNPSAPRNCRNCPQRRHQPGHPRRRPLRHGDQRHRRGHAQRRRTVSADPDRIAILDNFCWGNPTLPDRLGALVRLHRGCYEETLAYRTPFISGKDSLFNENCNGQPSPGTLLISAIGIVRIFDLHLELQSRGQPHLLIEARPKADWAAPCCTSCCGNSRRHRLSAGQPLNRYRLLQAIQQGLVRPVTT